MNINAGEVELKPSIHIRDRQIEQIGWMMRMEESQSHPDGRLFADGLASALSARLINLQYNRPPADTKRAGALPQLRLRRVCIRRILGSS